MINAAIIGLGWWGKTLVEAVSGVSDELRFVAGTTRSLSDEAQAFAKEHNMELRASFEDIIADPDIDAVVLVTPNSIHSAQTVAAAQNGKHVFCEKPFALTEADAAIAVAACEKAGVTLGVGYNRRFHPEITKLREMIAAGELGTILHCEATMTFPNGLFLKPDAWRASKDETPCGGLTPLGVHAVARVRVDRPVRIIEVERRVPPHQIHVRLVERPDAADVSPVAVKEVGLHLAAFDARGNHVLTEVAHVVVEAIAEEVLAENVDPHRRQIGTVLGHVALRQQGRRDLHSFPGLGRLGFLAKLADASRVVDPHRAEVGDLALRARQHTDRDVGLILEMVAQHLPVVHAVHMIAGEDQHQVAAQARDDAQVLAHGVGGTLEPAFVVHRLLGSQDLHEAVRERIEFVGSDDVPVQRDRVVLREQEHPLHPGVDGVADRNVDQSILAGDRHRRLGAQPGQRVQTTASAPSQDDHDHIPRPILPLAHAAFLR